jgi:predicted glycogen debranching enzyme
MAPDASATLALDAEPQPPLPTELADFDRTRATRLQQAWQRAALDDDDTFGQQLVTAIQAFVVRRGAGKTVIAGYPWFLDWGRDSLICARGMLAAGFVEEVRDLLVTYGRLEENGTLPNQLLGENTSNRSTSDAPLWYGVVCEELAALAPNRVTEIYQTRVNESGRTIAEVLLSIAKHYANGTTNGIKMDSASALIWSPAHFTWMDTNFPACTAREGYPIEIQILWVRLLRQLDKLGLTSPNASWRALADQAIDSIESLYWIDDRGYLADVLLADSNTGALNATRDTALRSNFLWAISMGILRADAARRGIAAALKYLVVPGALRTLAPLPVEPAMPLYGAKNELLNDPNCPYFGRYEGDEDTRRKPAYHNGTAWTWTFPTFCEALAVAWDFEPAAKSAAIAYLGSVDNLMVEGCVGHLPEITDGDAPHLQRGCDAQAWSVTEAFRVWKLLHR